MFIRAVVILLLFLLGPTQVYADVVINEIFPKTEDVAQQWIELYNTGPGTQELNLWGLSHTAQGGVKDFTFGAKTISPNDFLVLSQAETGIILSTEGDTIKLLDGSGNLKDTITYPGTLGYYTAIGRMPNGTGEVGLCGTDPYNKTPGWSNNCAAPTPTPTRAPTPTNTPGPTSTPTPVVTPTPTASPSATLTPTTAVLGDQSSFGFFMQVPDAPPTVPTLVETDFPTATPPAVGFMQSTAYRFAWVAGMGIGIVLAVAIVVIGKHHKKRKIVIEI